VNDERPSDITAKRRCERWVMRAAELITGVYLDNKEEAEVALLLRLDEGSIEDPAAPLLGAGRDTRRPGAVHSLVFELYLAAGDDEYRRCTWRRTAANARSTW
jgi:hypothetical protein